MNNSHFSLHSNFISLLLFVYYTMTIGAIRVLVTGGHQVNHFMLTTESRGETVTKLAKTDKRLWVMCYVLDRHECNLFAKFNFLHSVRNG